MNICQSRCMRMELHDLLLLTGDLGLWTFFMIRLRRGSRRP
jgi:hypothetical protein